MQDAVDRIMAQWREQRPDLNPANMGVVGRISRAGALVGKLIDENFARFGLTRWEFDVMASLRRSGPPYRLTVGRLQATMMISSGTMTNRLDRLERRGLVARGPDPDDRRGVLVELTPEGLRTVDEVVGPHLAAEADILAGLTPAEQERLAGLLKKLLLHLGD